MANTTKKITKRDHFNALLALDEVQARPELVDFINHEIDLLARKNASGEKKLTVTQKQNEELKNELVTTMEPNRMYQIGEMLKSFPCCADKSTSKISAMMTQLIAEGRVTRVEDKRKSFFQLV